MLRRCSHRPAICWELSISSSSLPPAAGATHQCKQQLPGLDHKLQRVLLRTAASESRVTAIQSERNACPEVGFVLQVLQAAQLGVSDFEACLNSGLNVPGMRPLLSHVKPM